MKKTLKIAELQQIENDKFVKKGNCTIYLDEKSRERILVNINDQLYSGFLRAKLTQVQKEKLAAARKKILEE